MNFSNSKLVLLTASLVIASSGFAQESGEDSDEQSRAAYQAAIEAARAEEEAARAALDRARADLVQAREEQAEDGEEQRRVLREVREVERAEMAAMREELSRVHDNLRRTSREVARVHRELDRSRNHAMVAPIAEFINVGDRAVIGVILGGNVDEGVEILGVSPDGPAERAGIQQGDVIISMMEEPLSGDSDEPRIVLNRVMEGVEVGDELVIAVDRDGEVLDFIVEADKREPFSWQSIVRLPSAPSAPSAPGAPTAPGAPPAPPAALAFEHIRIPQIHDKELQEKLVQLRSELDNVQIHINTDAVTRIGDGHQTWEYRFDSMSDLGGDVLSEANVWFGMPATRGIKMAEVDEGLGDYFGVDTGVLILSAKDDNSLQLQSGDVILQVGEHDVSKPADVVRALRDWEPGAAIELRIRREQDEETISVELPDHTMGFRFKSFPEVVGPNAHGDDH